MSFFPKVDLEPPRIDEDGAWVLFDGALKMYWLSQDEQGNSRSRHVYKANNPHSGAGQKSTLTPPYHYHLYETETFSVNSGLMCYMLDGRKCWLRAGESVNIPPGHAHTFWNDETTGLDLDVDISFSGAASTPNSNLGNGFDHQLAQNLYGYMNSCFLAGKTPNMFQLLAFIDHAGVIPTGAPLWLGIGRLVNVVLGRWVGRWVGGYKIEYSMFDGKKSD